MVLIKLYSKLLTSLFRSNDVIETLYLDISGSCNLSCRMCSLKTWYKNRGQMSMDTVSRLAKLFESGSVNRVSLQCNCEPLLNNNITDIVRFIKQKNKNIYIFFVTNGTLLNPQVIASLLKSGINDIAISLDGATKETYEKVRLGADFDLVISNIKELVRQRALEPNELKQIGLITVGTKENIYELQDILAIGKQLGVNYLIVPGLEPYTEEMANMVLYGRKISPQYRELFVKLIQKGRGYGINVVLPFLKANRFRHCLVGKCLMSCSIDWNGDLHPCSSLSYERDYYYLGKKTSRPRVTFGNINKQDIYDIWDSKEFKQFRHNVLIGRLQPYCRNCLTKDWVISPF